jgi:adenosine deaminase
MSPEAVMAVPKAELHCHIEGAVPPALARSQATRYGVDIAPFIARRNGQDSYAWSDFTSFLTAYDAVAMLFRTEEDYGRLAHAYLREIAEAGTLYSEIFVSPDHARAAGLSPQAYIEGLGAGIAAARDQYGIECRMIVVGVRHLGPDAVAEAARFAAARPHPLITGFGMAGDERIGHPKDFAHAFDIARDAGLGITVHAGELCGPESVRAALDHLRPQRIGHGVRAIEDVTLVRRLAEEHVHLEVCPGSNVALEVFGSFADHPFARLQAAGVSVSLNSDDPPFFATSLAQEYAMAAQHFGLDAHGLAEVTRAALAAAFLDEDTRGMLLARLDSAMSYASTTR